MEGYHEPVLAAACISALQIQPEGVYVDATFGGGGHTRKILAALGPKGKLVAFDQDQDALQNLPEDERLLFVQHNFRFLKRFLRLHGIRKVDGILADLGVSSHQLDVPERGFSFRFEADLDMRMNQNDARTAETILNTYSPADLQAMFSAFGEVRNAKTLALKIAEERQVRPLKSVDDLLGIMEPLIRGQRHRYLAQVFQAIRMEVNEEVEALSEFLLQCLEVLKPGAPLVVLSYHSIEDRMTKNMLKTGNPEGKVIKDFYGKIYRPFQIITKKAVLPTPEEIAQNPRARSAKLRVGLRTEEEIFDSPEEEGLFE
ncbi:MAG: 16S rRNA (cytosine(1402)-N(4))-methyltransferase RsmH [Bacteroidota bacterium]